MRRSTTTSKSTGSRPPDGRGPARGRTAFVVQGEKLEAFVRAHLQRAKRQVDIFSPFVTVSALDALASCVEDAVTVCVVVRWRVADFVAGVADLDLYRSCKDRGWSLLAHPRLHLKSILCDKRLLVTGSANITAHGLGTHATPNLETLVGELSAPREYVTLLGSIKHDARIIDGPFVDALRLSIDRLRARFPDLNDAVEAEEWELLGVEHHSGAFLISQLPMSKHWESVYRIGSGAD